jgi:hypothetical protein
LFYADIKDSIDKPPTNGLANRFHYEWGRNHLNLLLTR